MPGTCHGTKPRFTAPKIFPVWSARNPRTVGVAGRCDPEAEAIYGTDSYTCFYFDFIKIFLDYLIILIYNCSILIERRKINGQKRIGI